jgi:hypothetical protein
VLNASFGATACLRLLISKALGLGIVLFGSILKLPQMAKIVRVHHQPGVRRAPRHPVQHVRRERQPDAAE